MADVAFLLLIFFLVTTTIATDAGILTRLPEISTQPPQPVIDRNSLEVLINAQDNLLVDDEPTDISELRTLTKKFLDNRGVDPTLSDSPTVAVISLQNDRSTTYSTYLLVQNELKAAYRELRDAYALDTYGKTMAELKEAPEENLEQIKDVANAYPMRLSEAEPKNVE